jgi:hypothetical protein
MEAVSTLPVASVSWFDYLIFLENSLWPVPQGEVTHFASQNLYIHTSTSFSHSITSNNDSESALNQCLPNIKDVVFIFCLHFLVARHKGWNCFWINVEWIIGCILKHLPGIPPCEFDAWIPAIFISQRCNLWRWLRSNQPTKFGLHGWDLPGRTICLSELKLQECIVLVQVQP